MTTKKRILKLIGRKPRTAKFLASELGLSYGTVRNLLSELSAEGTIETAKTEDGYINPKLYGRKK